MTSSHGHPDMRGLPATPPGDAGGPRAPHGVTPLDVLLGVGGDLDSGAQDSARRSIERARRVAAEGDLHGCATSLIDAADLLELDGDLAGAVEALLLGRELLAGSPHELELLERAAMVDFDSRDAALLWAELAERHDAAGAMRDARRTRYFAAIVGESTLRAARLDPMTANRDFDGDLAGIDGWSLRARAMQLVLDGQCREATRLDERALQLARQDDDGLLEALTLEGLAYAHSYVGSMPAALEAQRRCVQAFDIRRMHWHAIKARTNLASMYLEDLQIAASLATLQVARTSSDAHRLAPWTCYIVACEAIASALSGQCEAAVAMCDQVVARASGSDDARDACGVVRATIAALAAGAPHATIDGLIARADAMDLVRQMPSWSFEVDVARTVRMLEDGDIGGALLAASRLEVDEWGSTCEAAVRLARCGLSAGVQGLVDRAAEMLAPFDGSDDVARARLSTREVQAIAAGDVEELEACEAGWTASGGPLDAAWCVLARGLLVLRDGNRRAAMPILADAHRRFLLAGHVDGASRAATGLQQAGSVAATTPIELSSLFAGLTPAERVEVDARLVRTPFEKGRTFFRPDQPAECVFVLTRGRVRLARNGDGEVDGRPLTVSILDPGALFGESSLLGVNDDGLVAEAIDDGEVALIAPDELRMLLHAVPRIGVNLLDHLGRRLQRSEQLAEQIAYWSVERRLAHALLDLEGRYGHPTIEGHRIINQAFTQTELGELVGASRKAVAVLIGRLRREGVLELRGKRVVLLDLPTLRDMAGGESRATPPGVGPGDAFDVA